MDYEICYNNHDKIVKVHNNLNSKKGKKEFNDRVALLKKKDSKKALLNIIEMKWSEYNKLLKIIMTVCERIVAYKLGHKVFQTYTNKLLKKLNKINTPKEMHKFIYEILNDKNFYHKLIKFYEILSNKSKCMMLLR